MRVTIRYGTGNETTTEFPDGTTLSDVIGNPNVRGLLGYGQNVVGHIGGIPQQDSLTLFNGVVVEIHDKQSQKGS